MSRPRTKAALPAGTTIEVVHPAPILKAIEALAAEVRAVHLELAALHKAKAAPLPPAVRIEPASETSPALLTVHDVESTVRLGPRTIRRMAAAGQFPPAMAIDEGRAERWLRADVEAWVAAQAKWHPAAKAKVAKAVVADDQP